MRRKKLMTSHRPKPRPSASPEIKRRAAEQGFTLIETSIALVVMMIVGLGAASLFFFAINYNTGASDRQLAMGVAQKRMEWLRTIPFDKTTRTKAYTLGGLAATGANGVTETFNNAGRPYQVVTVISDLDSDPGGNPTLKRITIRVTPLGTGAALGTVMLTTLRATTITGSYS
jgi:type II secretory pathway pseudopilin PulG